MNARILICTDTEYHADPAPQPSLSSSIAKILLEQSPRHAWLAHPKLNPNFVPEEDERFDLGSAAHSMLLEGDASPIVWIEADDWRKKATKEARQAARDDDKLPLLLKYRAVLEAMVVEAHRFVASSELADILNTGDAEQTVIWQEAGTHCRARLDLLSAGRRIILDYKSTENAEPNAFIRQIGRMGYDIQAEFYALGIKALTGQEPTFVFLAQEITPPHSCSLVALSNAYREIGQSKVSRALRLWAYCLSRNEWPAYTNRICYGEPPAWMLDAVQSSDPP
jgi:hypothetical protein